MKAMNVFACLFLSLIVFIPGASAKAAESSQSSGKEAAPYRLLIYYGIPEQVNDAQEVEKAAGIFAQYDYIVFSAGLEQPQHKYSASTREIMAGIKKLNENARIFGYVDLGVTTKYNYTKEQLAERYRLWAEMGADGIFLDDAGHDFGVNRERLNYAVETVHSLSMSAFVNAWDPDDVFADRIDKEMNPDGSPTALGAQDYFLIESFLKPTDIGDPNSDSAYGSGFQKRIDKLLEYRKTYGTKLLSVSKIDYQSLSKNDLRKFFRMNEAAAGVFSLDGYGVAAWDYSAGTVNRNVVELFPYFENYMNYYKMDAKYRKLTGGSDYQRNGFRLHSEEGEHFYNIPELYGNMKKEEKK
ncbi:hypothetical protein PAE9249_01944 [Paenibacillus sp. CECT 9249]|uniref:hypothetical protein n=1 Tax=Paenibacillus sp. CECT 9249 TaxID=2845385 RepID=UPI001E6371BB|nr:hypothetical protein [Paenibacillus sp. CECT 9249]CAH0119441.1 hypothetical protein PAE9249_01944 [Paenibacillus sp. CECT 9249]